MSERTYPLLVSVDTYPLSIKVRSLTDFDNTEDVMADVHTLILEAQREIAEPLIAELETLLLESEGAPHFDVVRGGNLRVLGPQIERAIAGAKKKLQGQAQGGEKERRAG